MDMICRHNLLSHFLANMGGIYILVVVAVRTLYWRKIWPMQLKLWLRTTIQNYRRGGHILRNRLPCIYAITCLRIISRSDFPCSDVIFLDPLCEVEIKGILLRSDGRDRPTITWVCQNHNDSLWFCKFCKFIVDHRDSDTSTLIPIIRDDYFIFPIKCSIGISWSNKRQKKKSNLMANIPYDLIIRGVENMMKSHW
jgi:hypothetical protein